MKILIESQYAGSILYFAVLRKAEAVWLDQHEHFRKGSYRNRCVILGANGALRLSIPLQSGKDQNKPFEMVKISYAEPWQKIHWESLGAAYRSSPFFEYYEPQLKAFYAKQFSSLSDFNLQLFDQMNVFLKKFIPVQFTKSYEASETFEGLDLRNCIHPKNPISLGNELVDFPSYIQVFNDRFEFVPNLSIFDLLFNLGPKAGDYLDNLLITSV